MGRPWGLSGPEFLELYAALLVIWCVVVVVVRAGVLGRDVEGEPADPGLYERAYLNGGPDRVAETALAGLVESGAVRVDRSRRLHSTGGSAADPFQRAVLDAIGETAKVSRVRKGFHRHEACAELVRRLRESGLLVPAQVRAGMTALLAGFPVLLLVNFVRAVNGARLGFPIGGLVVEALVTLVVWSIAATHCGHPLPTPAGRAARRAPGEIVEERRIGYGGSHRRDRKPGTEKSTLVRSWRLHASAAERVAVEGLDGYPDLTIRELLRPPRSSGGAAGAGGAAGGGGGGGGGGCGGGGC